MEGSGSTSRKAGIFHIMMEGGVCPFRVRPLLPRARFPRPPKPPPALVVVVGMAGGPTLGAAGPTLASNIGATGPILESHQYGAINRSCS
jgi:hypothetical protein